MISRRGFLAGLAAALVAPLPILPRRRRMASYFLNGRRVFPAEKPTLLVPIVGANMGALFRELARRDPPSAPFQLEVAG